MYIHTADRNRSVRPSVRPPVCAAAGYCMYSSSTILVFTMGDGVNGFTLDPQIGEFVMTHPNIQVPKRGKVR